GLGVTRVTMCANERVLSGVRGCQTPRHPKGYQRAAAARIGDAVLAQRFEPLAAIERDRIGVVGAHLQQAALIAGPRTVVEHLPEQPAAQAASSSVIDEADPTQIEVCWSGNDKGAGRLAQA